MWAHSPCGPHWPFWGRLGRWKDRQGWEVLVNHEAVEKGKTLFFKKSFMDMSVLTPWDEMSRMKCLLFCISQLFGGDR